MYLVEASDPCQNNTVLELVHVIPMLLKGSRVSGTFVNNLMIRFQLHGTLREVLQLDR
jgi:hypothetical protein